MCIRDSTNNDSAYETALSLHKSGTKLNAIIDIRDNSSSEIVNKVKSLGIQIYWNHTVVNTKGYKRINKITIMKLNDKGNDVVGKKIELNCDCLAISGGWTPMVHLFTQSGGKLKFNKKDNIFVPDKTNLNQLSIGSAKGDFELDDVLKNSIKDTKKFLQIENSNFCLLYTSDAADDQ